MLLCELHFSNEPNEYVMRVCERFMRIFKLCKRNNLIFECFVVRANFCQYISYKQHSSSWNALIYDSFYSYVKFIQIDFFPDARIPWNIYVCTNDASKANTLSK